MKDVKLYSSNICTRCDELKKYLKEKDIEINTIDVTKDIKLQVEIYKLGGKVEVPMLYIEGKAIYDLEKIKDWLQENK